MNRTRPAPTIAHWRRIAALVLLLAGLATAPAAHAASTWYVAPDGSDSNDCASPTTACRTIGGAIGKSAAGDTVSIAAGTYAERLTIFTDVNLVGAGARETVIDGGGAGGVFTIFTARVSMTGLTIRNGRSVGAGGGITNFGTLALTDSSVSENGTSLGEGFQGFGGGIANFGTLALTNTTVLSNTGFLGGGIYSRGPLSAVNSTISGNSARVDGGGIANVLLGSASLVFSTVANNAADSDGDGTGDGGGLFNAATSTFALDSAVLGGNTDAGGQAPDCGGSFVSAGHNVVQDATGCTLGGPDSHAEVLGQDPLLGALADNGGPTLTHALLAGSPAIDHSDNPSCPAADQRGMARPQGAACDAGAYEAEPAPPPEEGVLYVAPDGDDANDCLTRVSACLTIGGALDKRAPGDTILVAAGTYAERLVIASDATVIGAGAGQTIIDGGGLGGVLTVLAGAVRLEGVTVRNGRSIGAGGGVANYGALTLAASEIRDSQALLGEGFQGLGGGIANFGTLALSGTTVLSNTGFLGGGLFNSGVATVTRSALRDNTALLGTSLRSGLGGGAANFGRLEVVESSIVGNSASFATGGEGLTRWYPGLGGGLANGGTLVLSGTSVLSNTASFGGGLVNLGVVDAVNSTLSGNAARYDGGAIANSELGTVRLQSVTVAENDAGGAGGGIFNEPGGAVTIGGTLLAGNSAEDATPECSGSLVSGGSNLVQSPDGCELAGGGHGDIVGEDALLAPLADNGGPTLTHALLAGSPAIDANVCGDCPATDQRGVARPQGVRCDIGAYEYGLSQQGPAEIGGRYFLPFVAN